MKATSLCALGILLAAQAVAAEPKRHPPAKVSFEDFRSLVAEVEPHRRERLVDLDTFLAMSRRPDVVILDTRSAQRYDRIHLRGAKHLSFPDFTQENLRTVIPSEDTTVLIYCNNNFDGNEVDFASKVFLPRKEASVTGAVRKTANSPKSQFASQEKPLMLALNIPTYVTLYGYGYRNVYELDELVTVTDPRIAFEGSVVGTK